MSASSFTGSIDFAERAGNVVALQGTNLAGGHPEHIVQIVLHIVAELVPVHIVNMEIQGHGLGQIVGFPSEGGGDTGIMGYVRISRCIDES